MPEARPTTADSAPPSSTAAAGGYSLASVLLTLVSLSFLAMAGFMVAFGDHRVSQAGVAAVQAFYAADSGLNAVAGSTIGYPADTTVFAGAADTTVVTATRLVELTGGRRLYVLRSRARHYASDGSVGARAVSAVLIADPDTTLRRPAVKPGTWREEL